MNPPFDGVAEIVDHVERVLVAMPRVSAWRLLARAYRLARTIGGDKRGEGAAVELSFSKGKGDAFWVDELDAAVIESRIRGSAGRRPRDWRSQFDIDLLRAQAGRATLPASRRVLALLSDLDVVSRLAALERSALAIARRRTNEHVEAEGAVAVERRIELASRGARSDVLGASIQLTLRLRRDANPRRLYGEELLAADLHDWTQRTRELAWFPDDAELEALVAEVLGAMDAGRSPR